MATVLTLSVGESSDTAVEGTDYTTVSNLLLTINANQTTGTATFQLNPTDDDLDEDNESLTIDGSVTGLSVTAATVTITDNDTAAVTVNPTTLSVTEGGSSSYTVVLTSQPTGNVTVTPSRTGSSDVTVSSSPLTFTPTNWSTARTVTVAAAEDTDALNDTATVTHAVSGADYATVTAASVTVTVADNETVSTVVALSVAPATVTESDGATVVTVTATLNQAPRNVATVLTLSVGESSDTAVEGTDYATVSNLLLTINANQTTGTATFQLNPTNDDLDEDNESLTIDGSVTGLSVTAATVTITDNDTAAVTVNPTTLSVTEGGSSSYTVVLTSQPTGNVTVTPSRTGSSDVTVSSSPLTFTPTNWSTARTVTVAAAEDTDALNDTATVTHTVSGADYATVTAASVTVTVTDDETVSTGVALSVAPATLSESAAATTITVTARLNQAPRNVATVLTLSVGESSDTAVEGTDYTTVNNLSLTINANQTTGTATFQLNPTDDDLDEDNESLTIDGSVTGLSVTAATVTITDNDTAAVTVNPTTLSVTEGGSSSYTVVLTSQPTGNVTVTPSRTGSSDVTVSSSPLTFTPTNWSTARTVTVAAAEDTDALNDTATVTHTVSGADYATVTAASVTVTVTDDETVSTGVALSVAPATLSESAAATTITVTATLNQAPRNVATVLTLSVGESSDTAVEGTDYTTVNNLSLTINANQTTGTATFQLNPTDDDLDEDNESLTIDGSVTGLSVSAASVTITDNDTAAVTVNPTTLSVTEGGSSSYTVVLASQPTGNVTVTPSRTGSSDVTVSSSPLTFTPTNWSTARTVTVAAAEDTDALNDTATVTHTVSGADYATVTAASVTVTVSDDETVSTVVALSVAPATLSESAAATTITVTARLNQAPRNAATVLTLSVGESSDTAVEGTDYTTVNNLSLTINANQTTGTATFQLNPTNDDLDEDNESLTIDGSVTGLSVSAASVTITDNDTAAVTVNPTTLSVTEGGSSSYTVVLASQPTSNVTVTPSRTGSSDVTVSSSPLTFTPTNWSTAQTVTVAAAEDTDALNDTATVTHAVSGADYATVTAASVAVTVADNETVDPLLTVRFTQSSYSVTEGHSVTVKVKLSADPGRTVTIPIRKVNQGGATATDYSGVPLNMTFNSGTTEATFSFSATADTVIETSEVVRLSFGALPAGVQAGNIDATNVIIGDTVRVTFLAGSYIAYEGGDDAQVSVQLSVPAPGRISIPLTAQGGNGATSDDWSGVPEELVFRRGDERKTFTVTAIDDAQNDSNELVLLSFRTLPVGVAAGNLDTAQVVLLSTETPAPSEPLKQPIQQSDCNNQASKIIVLDAIGVISVAGESDFWKVELDPHCLYIIEVLGSESGFDVLNEDTYPGELTLHDADLVARWNADRTVRLGGFSHSGQRNSIAITRQTEASGVMQFEVRSGDGGTGTYQIKIRVNNVCGIDPVTNRVIFPWGGGPDGYINDTRADTATTRSLDAHSHTDVIAQSDFLGDNWDSAPDEDWHRMVFRQGYTYTIEAWAADDVPVEHQATQLKILGIRDNNGDLVLGTSSGTGKRVSVVFEPQAAGTYYIAVGSGAADRTGAYMFSVQTVANNPVNQG